MKAVGERNFGRQGFLNLWKLNIAPDQKSEERGLKNLERGNL